MRFDTASSSFLAVLVNKSYGKKLKSANLNIPDFSENVENLNFPDLSGKNQLTQLQSNK